VFHYVIILYDHFIMYVVSFVTSIVNKTLDFHVCINIASVLMYIYVCGFVFRFLQLYIALHLEVLATLDRGTELTMNVLYLNIYTILFMDLHICLMNKKSQKLLIDVCMINILNKYP
jgi:hypothetical protein